MSQVPNAVGRPAARVPATVGPFSAVLPGDLGIAPDVRWDVWGALPSPAAVLALRGADGPQPLDLDPGTRHVWVDDETGPVAALRVRPVVDPAPDGAGRPALLVELLAVRDDVRQLGLGAALLVEAVARAGGRPLLADVPDDAAALFARLDFVPVADVADLTGAGDPARLTRMRREPDVPWRDD